MQRPLIFFWLLSLLICCQVTAASEPVYPPLTGRVVDQASLLSAIERDRLVSLLKKHEEETSNQIMVVTLNSLQGYNIEDFGYQLGRHWGIGQKERNNGVLLIVAPKEHKVRIEVGYGLEGTLTDFLANDIIQNRILPYFRNDQYPRGIEAGVRAIIESLQGSYEPVKAHRKWNPPRGLLALMVLFGALFTIVIIDYRKGMRRFAAGIFTVMVFGYSFVLAYKFILSLVLSILTYFFYSSLSEDLRRQSAELGKGNRSYDWNDYDDHGDGGFGGDSFGGGGFSGGGGSFGGGGASGSW